MAEIFKILDNYPAYRISNYGRIQTRWQMGGYYNGYEVKDRWRDLKPNKEPKGYLSVNLSNGKDKPKRFRIHNIVADAFLEGKKEGLIIRHLDSNPENNHANNLKWGTYLENENDKIKNGTWNTRNGGAKLTPSQVLEIRELIKNGQKHEYISNKYNVSRPTITRIANNKIWK
jgi:hypothetical protein